MGVRRAADFDWLDRPDAAAIERAEALLESLGAISANPNAASDLTAIGRKMLRLPMHPRYSRMLVEAARYGCLKEASLCAALVSGRDLLVRLSRDDQHVAKARENFEVSDQSDFFVLMEAFKYAQANRFDVDACRRYGVHAMSAQQVAVTWQQIYDIARKHIGDDEKTPTLEVLQRCILTGFVDQFCVRKDQGTLDCILTGSRTGTLMRESVVQKSPHLVVGTIREVSGKGGNLTLLGLATAVKIEWLRESFPQHFSDTVEHTYDRTHKRVAAIRYVKFRDLIVAQEHQKEIDPRASGTALAEAHLAGLFELPNLTHDLKQFIARVNLVSRGLPELEFPFFGKEAMRQALARAFHGITLAKEAQAAPLRHAIQKHLAPEQIGWLDELAPISISLGGPKPLKLQYPENSPNEPLKEPELQVKLHECFSLTEHPSVCEGKVPVRLWLCSPDGKRLQSTTNWPEFRQKEYPKLKGTLQKKFPGFTWL
jgi:ATP-dependent helicase HrpB